MQEDEPITPQTQRINAKLTASSTIFKQLVDSLRRKKRQVSPDRKQQMSQATNPQDSKSFQSHTFFSERNSLDIKNMRSYGNPSLSNVNLNAIKKQMDNHEELIRQRPRGTVNGRDTIKKKEIPQESFNHKIAGFQATMRNRMTRGTRGSQSFQGEICFNQQRLQNNHSKLAVASNGNLYQNLQNHNREVHGSWEQKNRVKPHSHLNFSSTSPQQFLRNIAKEEPPKSITGFLQRSMNPAMANSKRIQEIDERKMRYRDVQSYDMGRIQEENLYEQDGEYPQENRRQSKGFHSKSHYKGSSSYDQHPELRRNQRVENPKTKFQDTHKRLFNQQKFMRMSPSLKDRLPQKVQENAGDCLQFDYSFDAGSSQSNTISSNNSFSPFGLQFQPEAVRSRGNGRKQLKRGVNRVDTSELEEPLPVPSFLRNQ